MSDEITVGAETERAMAAIAEVQAERAAEAAELRSETTAEPGLPTTPPAPERVQPPSIGRRVHYVDEVQGGRRVRAATICAVQRFTVTLDVINHDGSHSAVAQAIHGDEHDRGAHWEWPTRV